MRRIILLFAFAIMIGGGAVVAASQSEIDSTPAVGDAIISESACATPIASPSSSPDASSTSTVEAAVEDLVATPEDEPGFVDPCATPEVGTPAS